MRRSVRPLPYRRPDTKRYAAGLPDGWGDRIRSIVTETPFRQLFYTSRSAPGVDVDGILHQSRHNNAVDGITGLLWHDGTHFLQVIEGPEASVAATYARIADDPRHAELTILSDRLIGAREFGYWSMERATRSLDDGEAVLARIERRLARAPEALRSAFTAAAIR